MTEIADGTMTFEGKADSDISIFSASRLIVLTAGPSILSFFLQYGVELINIFFIGNIDKERLDGIGLANMWGNVTGLAIGWGLAGGMDTLCSQAYGKNDLRTVGVWLQRGIFVVTMFMIPITFAWVYTEQVLLGMGIDYIIAYYGGNYLVRVLPGLWFFLAFDCYRRFMYAQQFFWPCMIVNLVTTALHVFWCWLFIIEFDTLERGAGWATALTYTLNFVLLMIIVRVGRYDRDACQECTFENFGPDLLTYLKYAIPSMFMLITDFSCFEVTQLEANQFGYSAQAAHVSMLNTNGLFFMIPFGLGISISSIIGNIVGANKPKLAKSHAKAALFIILLTNVPFMICLFAFRRPWSSLYTYDEEVRWYIYDLLLVVCPFNLFDSLQIVLCGIVRGLGQQVWGFLSVTFSYYILALPLGFVFAFVLDMKVIGLWLGLLVGSIVANILLVILLACSNWTSVDTRTGTVNSEEADLDKHLLDKDK